ncbi:hypothetical protein MRX96_059784 [Rhipicephalus microplus]
MVASGANDVFDARSDAIDHMNEPIVYVHGMFPEGLRGSQAYYKAADEKTLLDGVEASGDAATCDVYQQASVVLDAYFVQPKDAFCARAQFRRRWNYLFATLPFALCPYVVYWSVGIQHGNVKSRTPSFGEQYGLHRHQKVANSFKFGAVKLLLALSGYPEDSPNFSRLEWHIDAMNHLMSGVVDSVGTFGLNGITVHLADAHVRCTGTHDPTVPCCRHLSIPWFHLLQLGVLLRGRLSTGLQRDRRNPFAIGTWRLVPRLRSPAHLDADNYAEQCGARFARFALMRYYYYGTIGKTLSSNGDVLKTISHYFRML